MKDKSTKEKIKKVKKAIRDIREDKKAMTELNDWIKSFNKENAKRSKNE